MIAGEPSGDLLGAALMGGLKELDPEGSFEGVGGPSMIAQGMTSNFEMSELSVMGIAEVLPKYRHLKRRIRETADAVIASDVDAMITIDSPDFCLRVARLVKAVKPNLRTIHYVAPTVWAWRPGRADKMAKVIDHVLALLPFEPPYMEAAGMGCDFVGHPVTAEPQASEAEMAALREAHGIGADEPVMLVLPGSRRSEVTRLAPVFGEALRAVLAKRPELRVVVPTTDGAASTLIEQVATWPGTPVVLDPRGQEVSTFQTMKRATFGTAELALAASGTVSLELAAARTPMVIAYDMNWLSRQIIWRMVNIDTVTLVNLVAETRAVPEYLGLDCKPEAIAKAVLALSGDPSAQFAAMDVTMERLGRGAEPPGVRAAKAVLGALEK